MLKIKILKYLTMASLTPSTFDINKLTFGKPQYYKDPKTGKQLTNKGQVIYLSYTGVKQIKFDLKNARIAHPVKPYRDAGDTTPYSAQDKFFVQFDFGRDEKGNPENNIEFYKLLTKIQNKLKEYASEHSEEWFDEERDESAINAIMNKIITQGKKIDRDDKQKNADRYADSFKARLLVNRNNGEIIPKFFDGAKNNESLKINIENSARELPRGTMCNARVKFTKVYLINGKLGFTIDLESASVNRPETEDDVEPPPALTDGELGRQRNVNVLEDDDDNNPQNEKYHIPEGKQPVDEDPIDEDPIDLDKSIDEDKSIEPDQEPEQQKPQKKEKKVKQEKQKKKKGKD